MKKGVYVLRSEYTPSMIVVFKDKKSYRKYINDMRKSLKENDNVEFTLKQTEQFIKSSDYLEFVEFY